MLVWVDAWQLQCCGDPFAVGSRVEWTLSEISDRDWLTSVVGDDLAVCVTHGEEHHGDLGDDAPTTIGDVIRIRAVSCKFGPSSASPAGNVHVPIPGTATIVEVADADGWYAEADDRMFNGYLVDLRHVKG